MTAALHSSRRILRAGIAVALVILCCSPLFGWQQPTEYQVKAAYLYNFSKFIKWPANAPSANSDSFTICVLGSDPFGAVLDGTVAGEAIDNKRVAVRRVATAKEAAGCRIVFISATEDARLKPLLLALDKSGALTVSDMPGFTDRGGMIQFVLDGHRVRFEINLAAASSAGLSLSSELLRVATVVRQTPPGDR